MKFKIDHNLREIANELRTRPADIMLPLVSKELCRRFIDAGMIEDTPDNYGESVLIATGPHYVKDICELLAEYLYNEKTRPINADVFDAFCRLTVIGDGDCPKCGGELKFDETIGHELKDGDYYTPNSYVIDYYVYHCPICGETIKSKNEL